ncbi:MAG: PadR family transcriptional regulator [Chloroflexota bacterium]|nr:PadR family transcriptional regulator [Chloroflexota bacterium]
MHKVLLLLGLLLDGPLYGYQLHQIVRAHGELYADLKKANLYYLLERLAKDGSLEMAVEPGAKGARGERLIYTITEAGRTQFHALLRETLLSYEPVHTGIETAVVFLSYLSPEEGIGLLQKRRQAMQDRRVQVVADVGQPDQQAPLVVIAGDHLLSLIDAELAWIDRSLTYLREAGWTNRSAASPSADKSSHSVKKTCPGNQQDTSL